jgi:hypothetical protein
MIKVTTIVRGLCPLFLSSDGTRGMFGALSAPRHQLRIKFSKDQNQIHFVTEPGEIVKLEYFSNDDTIPTIQRKEGDEEDSFSKILDFLGFVGERKIPLDYRMIKTRFYFNSGIVKACPVDVKDPVEEHFYIGTDENNKHKRMPKDIEVEKILTPEERCIFRIGSRWEYEIVQDGDYLIEFRNDCTEPSDGTPDVFYLYQGIAKEAKPNERIHFIQPELPAPAVPGERRSPIGVPRSCGGVYVGGAEDF